MFPYKKIKHLSHFAKIYFSLLLVTSATQAWAHGLEIRLFPEGDQIIGQVLYEDGSPWFAETVSIQNLTAPETNVMTDTTDSAGGFSVTGVIGHEYLITAADDTGHVTETRVTLDGSATEVTTVTNDEPSSGIPFYVIAGALLLLSIIPARYLKHRSDNSA